MGRSTKPAATTEWPSAVRTFRRTRSRGRRRASASKPPLGSSRTENPRMPMSSCDRWHACSSAASVNVLTRGRAPIAGATRRLGSAPDASRQAPMTRTALSEASLGRRTHARRTGPKPTDVERDLTQLCRPLHTSRRVRRAGGRRLPGIECPRFESSLGKPVAQVVEQRSPAVNSMPGWHPTTEQHEVGRAGDHRLPLILGRLRVRVPPSERGRSSIGRAAFRWSHHARPASATTAGRSTSVIW